MGPFPNFASVKDAAIKNPDGVYLCRKPWATDDCDEWIELFGPDVRGTYGAAIKRDKTQIQTDEPNQTVLEFINKAHAMRGGGDWSPELLQLKKELERN